MSARLKTVAAAAFLVVAAGSASAATTSFNFDFSCGGAVACDGGYSSLPSSFVLNDGAVSVEAKAGAFTSLSASSNSITSASYAPDARIGRYSGGAGVINSATDGSHTVDGSGFDDFIQLTFSQQVNLNSIDFSSNTNFFSNDSFRILFDTNGDGQIGVGDFISNSLRTANPFNFSTALTGNVWGIAALNSGDDFKVQSVAGTFATPAAVPLPAAAWMLIAALGGLVGLRRRKTA